MLCGNLQSKIPATLKVTWITSFIIQVDQGSPCVGTHEPAWETNESCLKLYETVGPFLHGLCAPFLKIKIELPKLQAAKWNTLMGFRDDLIMDFYYLIQSCFWKIISVSDPNPVLVETVISVSDPGHLKAIWKCIVMHNIHFLCCVYFASWGKTALRQNNC